MRRFYPVFKRKQYKEEAKLVFKKNPGYVILCVLVSVVVSSYLSGMMFNIYNIYEDSFIIRNLGEESLVFTLDVFCCVIRPIFHFLPIPSWAMWVLSIFYIFFVANLLSWSITNALKDIAHDDGRKIDLFKVFTNRKLYIKALCADFMVSLLILIGAMCFIFPAIYVSLRLFYVPYLITEEPDLSVFELLQRSSELTKDIKFDLIVLPISFYFWIFPALLLSVFAGFGIGILEAYVTLTIARSCFDLIAQHENKEFMEVE